MDQFKDKYTLLLEFLKNLASAKGKTTYSEAGAEIRASGNELFQLLDRISKVEAGKGRPLLSILVVNPKRGDMPGPGFFKTARKLGIQTNESDEDFFRAELQRVYAEWNETAQKPATIPEALKQLYAIVDKLCAAYPGKKFTLDGRLVGDIGEVLVQEAYDLKLNDCITKHHDGRCPNGRLVQIKATMKGQLTFPHDHIPEYYIGIHIRPNGQFEEIFNGPGEIIRRELNGRAKSKNNLHSISIERLRELQRTVPVSQRIPRRSCTLPQKLA